MKLIVERSEATGDWWVRCVAGNHKLVGSTQEGYRKRAHAVQTAGVLALRRDYTGDLDVLTIAIVKAEGGWRWHLVANNGRLVFGSHETLTSRSYARRMALRVLTEAHELEVRP